MFVIAALWVHGASSVTTIESRHWGWLTLSMLASYGFADVVFLAATRDLGVPGALSVASFYPVWTVLLGVIRGEKLLAMTQYLGLGITLVGVISTVLAGAKVQTRPRTDPGAIRRGVGFAALTSLLWAVNSFSVAQGASDLPVHWVNVIRMLLALILCGALGWWREGRRSLGWRPWLQGSSLRSRFWVFPMEAFGGALFFAYGLTHSPLVLASTLSSLAPVLSVPLAWWNGTENVSFPRVLGVLVVTGGLYLLLSP
jgi:drug/metabolite transporter (DMT)-like permease